MSNAFITFRPIGRLGNNMFQTAACIGYAKKYGIDWKVPVQRYPGDNDPWLLTTIWPNLPTCHAQWAGTKYNQHEGKDYDYKPIPRVNGHVTLVGFFQSEKFFEGAHEEIRQAFPLKDYPEYRDYVSIHVRRGDFVQYANSFPPVTDNYLLHSTDVIDAEVGISRFLVFSDDIEWCKQYFKKYGDVITFFEDMNEYNSLSAMASCSHNIIANSSFSWWAAWLNKNPDKLVVSPSHLDWYGPNNGVVTEARMRGKEPCIDLIPDGWHQIKFR